MFLIFLCYQTAKNTYTWICTWFTTIETIAEFNASFASLDKWLLSVLNPNSALYGAIQEFLVTKLMPHTKRFLRVYRFCLRGFDEMANSICESQNSSIKRGIMRVVPNMSLPSSAQLLTDKSKVLQNYRDVSNARALNATSLWSATSTSCELTKYAEGLVAQSYDKRKDYKVAQGMNSILF
jgi:hypothetical protein